jgi:SAM-dependent methyltransferase
MRTAANERLARLFRATEEENRRVIESLTEPRPGGTLLDLGCGDGDLTVRAGELAQASRVLGLEGFPGLAEEARSRGVVVTEGDLADPLPYDDASIDVVLSNQVIEHLCDTDRFMSEIARVLKPSGYAVVSTNNLASWHNVAALTLGWQPMPCHVSDQMMLGNPASFAEGTSGYYYPMHRRIFTGRALAQLATHHGLVVDRDLAAGWYPLPPRAARLMTRFDRRHGAFLVQRYTKTP